MTTRLDSGPITLLVTGPNAPPRSWNATETRFIDLRNLAILEQAMHSFREFHGDVTRAVIDHAATPEEALQLLAAVPPAFTGDVLFLCAGDSYVSAKAPGQGRMLRTIASADLQCYLEAHQIVAARQPARASFANV